VGGKYSVRPPDEDAVWQSEVRLKGVAGDTDTQCCVPDSKKRNPYNDF